MFRNHPLRLTIEVGLAVATLAGIVWISAHYQISPPSSPSQPPPQPSPQPSLQRVVYNFPPGVSEDNEIAVVIARDGPKVEDTGWILRFDGALVDVTGHEIQPPKERPDSSQSTDEVVVIQVSVEDVRANPLSDIASTVKSLKQTLPRNQKALIIFHIPSA
jgi:hypothetical protein